MHERGEGDNKEGYGRVWEGIGGYGRVWKRITGYRKVCDGIS